MTISINLQAETNSPPPAADHPKINQRGRSTAAPAGDQGKNNLPDRDLMEKTRRSLTDDKSLSTSAHNVKIISQNDQVTLKGPVASEEEKLVVGGEGNGGWRLREYNQQD